MRYHYCPQCGVQYSKDKKTAFAREQRQLVCDACAFVLYNNPHPAVGALIVDALGAIMLVQRGIAPHKGDWDLPGGFMEHGETPEQSIIRELQEELGITNAETKGIVGSFGVYYANEGRTQEEIYVLSLVIKVRVAVADIIGPADDICTYNFFAPCALPENIAFPEQKKFLLDYASACTKENRKSVSL